MQNVFLCIYIFIYFWKGQATLHRCTEAAFDLGEVYLVLLTQKSILELMLKFRCMLHIHIIHFVLIN